MGSDVCVWEVEGPSAMPPEFWQAHIPKRSVFFTILSGVRIGFFLYFTAVNVTVHHSHITCLSVYRSSWKQKKLPPDQLETLLCSLAVLQRPYTSGIVRIFCCQSALVS